MRRKDITYGWQFYIQALRNFSIINSYEYNHTTNALFSAILEALHYNP